MKIGSIVNFSYGLDSSMVNEKFEVILYKEGPKNYSVNVLEISYQPALYDSFAEQIGGETTKAAAIQLQNETFDYMIEKGFTRVKKVYCDISKYN